MLNSRGSICDWAGGEKQAIDWPLHEPIPAFGGKSCAALLESGAVEAVGEYLDHIKRGGFA